MTTTSITVKAGDTLSAIAAKNGMTVKQLAELNGIKDINNIKIGQELVLREQEGIAVESAEMSEAEFNKKFNHTQKQIDALKNRSITQQAKEEISQYLNSKKEMLKALGKEVSQEVKDSFNEFEAELEEAYQKGGEYYTQAKNAIRDKVNNMIETSVGAVKDGAEYVSDKAVGAYRTVKNTVEEGYDKTGKAVRGAAEEIAAESKSAVKSFFASARAEIHESKDNKPDFSTMTRDEIMAYQESELQALKNETLPQRAKREIKQELHETKNEIKESYNSALDTLYSGASKVYNGTKNAAKKVFGWLGW